MALAIQDLLFERNNRYLFRGLSFELKPGECLQIQGANGSGKSTLLRILAGLLEPHEGKIDWHQHSLFEQREAYQQQLHYIGHQNGIKRHLSVFENLVLSAALAASKCNTEQIKAAAAKVKLDHALDIKAMVLSAGQLRRLSLARILLNPLPLWILDEPTSALDIAGQQLLTDLLSQHLKNSGMAIIATHQPLSIDANIIQL